MSGERVRIGFVGSGNMAWNLAHALKGGPYELFQVISRTAEHAKKFAGQFEIPHHGEVFSELRRENEIVFIATNDRAISLVAAQLAPFAGSDTVFVHCSGSTALADLRPLEPNTGVLYPMQTMNQYQPVDFANIPVFIEGAAQVLPRIRALAQFLSRRVTLLDSDGRMRLHLGAIFACNFPNLMWIISQKLLEDLPGVEFRVYEHLVRETVENVFRLGPLPALTGPARRGDEIVMEKHVMALSENQSLRELYQRLSEMITGLGTDGLPGEK